MTRYRCSRCEAVVNSDDLLIAQNPFNPTSLIDGCPKCLSPFDGRLLCDVDDCPREAGCGTPTRSGYRQTCDVHRPTGGDAATVAET